MILRAIKHGWWLAQYATRARSWDHARLDAAGTLSGQPERYGAQINGGGESKGGEGPVALVPGPAVSAKSMRTAVDLSAAPHGLDPAGTLSEQDLNPTERTTRMRSAPDTAPAPPPRP